MPTLELQLHKGQRIVIQKLTRRLFENLLENQSVKKQLVEIFNFYKPGVFSSSLGFYNYGIRLEYLEKLDPPVEIEVLVSHFPSMTPLGFMSLSGIDFSNSKAEFSMMFFRGRGSRSMIEAVQWALDKIFLEFSIEKLIIYVLSSNSRIISMLKKYEFTTEAVLIKEILNEAGIREDVNRYSLFKDEWYEGKMRLKLQILINQNQ